jgi:hypothetical protein
MDKPVTIYCYTCKKRLPPEQFRKDAARNICRLHYNKQQQKKRAQDWSPLEKKANIIWQVAYADSKNIFKHTAVTILLAEVVGLCTQDRDFRLVPVDPLKQLSLDNCAMVSLEHRKVLVRCWKRSPEYYTTALAEVS